MRRPPLCLLFILILFPGIGQAQALYGPLYRPAAGRYQVLDTPHFEIIFEAGLEQEAREAGALLEGSLSEVRGLVGLQRTLRMPVVLNGFNDLANGYVDSSPFRQEIEGTGIKGKVLDPGYLSWLEAVLPHELAHAAQAEVRPFWGIGGLAGLAWPDFSRGLNFTIPRGLTEGLAVYYESRIRPGAGRMNYSLFRMRYRAASGSRRPWSLAQLLERPIYDQPSDRFYLGGAHLVSFLADEHGEAFFQRSLRLYNRWPFFGFGVPMWIATGEAPFRLGRRFRAAEAAEEAARLAALAPLIEGDKLASKRGENHRRPRWIDDSTLVVYADGYDVRPGFYTIHAVSGDRQALSSHRVTEDVFYTYDDARDRLLYARYSPSRVSLIKWTTDVHEVDVHTGRSSRLSTGGRLFAPVTSAHGEMWALQVRGSFTTWVRMHEDGSVSDVTDFDRSDIKELAPSPTGESVAVLASVRGKQGIFRAQMINGSSPVFEPLLFAERGSVYDPSWSPDGRYLIFSADPDGVANIFALDVATDLVVRLTNVPYGAIEPSVSPDGNMLAYVSYADERYELAVMPFAPNLGIPWSRRAFSAGLELPLSDQMATSPYLPAEGPIRPYRALPRALKPRALVPVIDRETPPTGDSDLDLGWALGLTLAGTDPLQRWAYDATGFRQASRWWGDVSVSTGRIPLTPRLRLFTEPSSQQVRLVDAAGQVVDTVRVGREEQGVQLGGSLPLYLDVDVFQTTAAFSLQGRYRRVRFFDADNEPLSDFSNRWTVLPAAVFSYRMQANRRDIVPTSGFRARVSGEWDVHAPEAEPSRAWLVSAEAFFPSRLAANQSIRLTGGLLSQNKGSIYDSDLFLPRGYEDDAFLSSGTYLKGGLELTAPLWFVENGLVLLPVYVHALYLYSFVEAVAKSTDLAERYSSVGVGLGVRFRLAHFVDARIQVGVARQLETRQWNLTFR